MTTNYTSNTDSSIGYSDGGSGTTVEVMFLYQVVAQNNLDNKEEMAMIKVIMKS